MCKFSGTTATQLSEFLNGITGWDCSTDDLCTIGERSIDIKRAISNKLGVTRQHDRMPKISIAPMPQGSTAGKSPDMEVLLREYYEYRQWDWDVANDLWA